MSFCSGLDYIILRTLFLFFYVSLLRLEESLFCPSRPWQILHHILRFLNFPTCCVASLLPLLLLPDFSSSPSLCVWPIQCRCCSDLYQQSMSLQKQRIILEACAKSFILSDLSVTANTLKSPEVVFVKSCKMIFHSSHSE